MTCTICNKESFGQEICSRCKLSKKLSSTASSRSRIDNAEMQLHREDKQERLSNKEKVEITSLFLENSHSVDGSDTNLGFPCLILGEILDRHEETLSQRRRRIEENEQLTVEINRPRNILEIEIDSHSILEPNEIQRIENIYSESIDRQIKIIREQGPDTDATGHVTASVKEKEREFYTYHIQSLRKQIAELKLKQSINSRRRRIVDAEITFNMTDAEKEDFNRRARKATQNLGKLPSDKRAEKDALAQIRKEKRDGAKLLKQFGEKGIAMAVSMYNFTEKKCRTFLQTGEI